MRMAWFVALMTSLLATSLVASPAAAAEGPVFTDGFESYPVGTWAQENTYGAWDVAHDGYGRIAIEQKSSKVMMQAPKASTSVGETHSGLVRSVQSYGDIDLTVRMRTVKQLRTPTPNAWEVAWLNWHYTDNQTFYYIVLKPNGWELGKVDGTKVDPAGPACVWPEYRNCAYPGAQRFLATGSAPSFPVGPWYTVNVRHVGSQMDISVNGASLVSFTDTERPYTSGKVSLYNEDAHVEFDDVRVEPLGPLPAPSVPSVKTSPSAPIQKVKTFAVKWTPASNASSYDVLYRRAAYASGGFTPARTLRSKTPWTGANFSGYPGYTYCFRARSRDAAGNVSAYGRETCAAHPIDSRSLYRSGRWTIGTTSSAYRGSYWRTTSRGATLRRAGVRIKQIWLVARKCPGCGTVDVFLGNTRVARINLNASRTLPQQVIRATTLASPRGGTVTLRVVSSGRPVMIEGLGLLRA